MDKTMGKGFEDGLLLLKTLIEKSKTASSPQ
jgi:hypothetical protein